tara:strand:- start:79 stop:306 length:228 start_codon:yes stop_codon:yes gene_type:complete
MKTNKPYRDKNLTQFNYDGEEISEVVIVTSGMFEETEIVHLEIKTIDGKTLQFRYWDEYNYKKRQQDVMKEMEEK